MYINRNNHPRFLESKTRYSTYFGLYIGRLKRFSDIFRFRKYILRLLTYFTWTTRCVQSMVHLTRNTGSSNFKIWKFWNSKIYSRKIKISQNRFGLLNRGPPSIGCIDKRGHKSHDTVTLSRVSWYREVTSLMTLSL